MYHIMIADDENIIREGLRDFIDWNKLNCSVDYVVSNGIDCLEKIKSGSVDILITDIRMPGKSGLDVVQYIHDNLLPTKTIILSGYSDFKYAQKALQNGSIDFILKDNPLGKVEDAVLKAIKALEKEQSNSSLLKDLQNNIKQQQEDLKIKFFLDLINDIPYTEGELEEKVQSFNLNINEVCCISFQIRVVDHVDKADNSITLSITRFLNKIFEPYKPTIFLLHADMLCMVLTNAASLTENFISQTIKKLFLLTEKFQHYQIKAAVSTIHSHIADINKAYLECIYCFKHNPAGSKKTIFYKQEALTLPQNNSLLLKKVYSYIDHNYAKPITLIDIANHVGRNPSYFSRLFKQETNDSVTRYLTKYRVEKAKELLMDDTLRLSDISEAVGFNDFSYFSSTFKKYTGYSPTDYRTITLYNTKDLN